MRFFAAALLAEMPPRFERIDGDLLSSGSGMNFDILMGVPHISASIKPTSLVIMHKVL